MSREAGSKYDPRPPIRLIPSVTGYNNLKKLDYSLSILILTLPTQLQKNFGDVKVESKDKMKDSQLKLNVVHLCSSDTETYIKWRK